MNLDLQALFDVHPKLRGYAVDLTKLGALALQRSGHVSPVEAEIDHSGRLTEATVEWLPQEPGLLAQLDVKRVTEDGAEAVALAYVNAAEGWTVKRRMQQGESADWLLRDGDRWLALEISGTAEGDPRSRLQEKRRQLAQCTLPAERLAVVVSFEHPSIHAENP